MADRRRVVITGMGVVTALGESVDGFWDRLIAGEEVPCDAASKPEVPCGHLERCFLRQLAQQISESR